jgi:hypothetical protein
MHEVSICEQSKDHILSASPMVLHYVVQLKTGACNIQQARSPLHEVSDLPLSAHADDVDDRCYCITMMIMICSWFMIN